MKYLLGTITTLLIILSFTNRKCEHVFTMVEQAELKVERPSLSGSIVCPIYSWPTGLQEGKELICVKCFHKQKQVLDYGQPCPSRNEELKIPDWWKGTTLGTLTDTCVTLSKTLFLKGDTLIWSTVK